MYDIDLRLCARRVSRELEGLLGQLIERAPSRFSRGELFDQACAFAEVELASASQRWTPIYDRALHGFAEISLDELYNGRDGRPRYAGPDHFKGLRMDLDSHQRICIQLDYAESIGARTLADAFRCLVITGPLLHEWLALCPAQAELDERIREVARDYLDASGDHTSVHALLDAEYPSRQSFAYVPAAVIAALGNPFDPLI